MGPTAIKPAGDDRREQALVARIADGDRAAFDELFRLYHPRLFRFAFRLTSSYGLADEVASDVLLAVWQGAGKFRKDSRVSTWVFGIAYRRSLKSLRWYKHKAVPLKESDTVDTDSGARLEREEWVARAIDVLPPKQKLTVMLVYYVGMTCEETAIATDTPAATVRTRMHHARKTLESKLKRLSEPGRKKGNA